MFDKFGEFDSAGELNKAAAGLLAEGDTESIFALAKENGIDREDARDYIEGNTTELSTPLMAAVGKLEVEKEELKIKGVLEDWHGAVSDACASDTAIAEAVRKKNKSLKEFMSKLLAKAFNDKVQVDDRIVSITEIEHNGKTEKMRGPVYLGIPSRADVKKLVKEYYLGQGADR